MTHRAEDPLRSLSTLEGEGASVGFTAQVLDKLAARKTRRRRQRQLTLASVAAGLALAAVGLYSVSRAPSLTRTELTSEAQLLQLEYAQLQADLEALRVSTRDTAPVLYLGGDDQMDLVLDLAPIITQSAPAAVRASSAGVDPYEL